MTPSKPFNPIALLAIGLLLAALSAVLVMVGAGSDEELLFPTEAALAQPTNDSAGTRPPATLPATATTTLTAAPTAPATPTAIATTPAAQPTPTPRPTTLPATRPPATETSTPTPEPPTPAPVSPTAEWRPSRLPEQVLASVTRQTVPGDPTDVVIQFLASLLWDASGADGVPFLSARLRDEVQNGRPPLALLGVQKVYYSFSVSWLAPADDGEARAQASLNYPGGKVEERVLTLIRQDGAWRIDDIALFPQE